MTYPIAKPKVRVFTWIILAINILMLIWLVAGIVNASHNANNCGTLSQEACTAAKDIGNTIGAGLIIGLWVALDLILGVLWLVTRKRRPQIIYINQAPIPPSTACCTDAPGRNLDRGTRVPPTTASGI